MKVIFLDIDGVLNSQDNADALYSNWCIRHAGNLKQENHVDNIYKDYWGVLFDQRCVNWLEYIVSQTGAFIVMTSDWRKAGLVEMSEMWYHRKLPGTLLGTTNIREDYDRALEIKEIVDDLSLKNYVIIDDIGDWDFPEDKFVKTNYRFGITGEDVHKVVKILNNV